MRRSRIFRWGSVLFLSGVAISGLINFNGVLVGGGAFILIVSLIIGWQRGKWRFLIIFIFIFLSGIIRWQFSEMDKVDARIEKFNGRLVIVQGQIVSPPDIRDTHQKLTLDSLMVGELAVGGRLLLLTDLDNELTAKNIVRAECFLEKPQMIENFRYDLYLERFGVYSICAFPPAVEVVEVGHNYLAWLYNIKDIFKKNINTSLHEPQAALLNGLLLGERKGLGDDLTEIFRRAGLSHIVALSGYNIAILVLLFIAIGPWLMIPRRWLFYLLTGVIILFVIVTGASPSVVRAGLMGWLVLFAYEIGRLSQALNLLLATAVLMVLINPKILLYDIGWQLSFLATFALIEAVPLVKERFNKLPNYFGGKDIMITTLAAIIFTLPLSIWQFGGWSVIAPLANLLVLPVMPLLMSGGLTVGLLGGDYLLSPVWVLPTELLLRYVIFISRSLADYPGSYLTITDLSFTVMLFIYGCLFTIVYSLKIRNK